MLCKNPYMTMGRAYGCGQCMPCRLNRRRIWSHRILLESRLYEDNAFVTLTYDEEHLPANGSVVPDDVQLWIKRLRKHWEPRKLRFFCVGEYGDSSFRPHYHAALFNFPCCVNGLSQFRRRFNISGLHCCVACDSVASTWSKGNVVLGRIEDASASYLAGYVTKKMTDKGDPRLNGKHPEFCRMSLRPGIGGDAMWDVADVLLRYELERLDTGSLRHGSKELPLGRYLQRRLRGMCGKDEKAPQEVLDKIEAEMLPLRVAAKADEVDPSLKSKFLAANKGKLQRLEARQRIFKQRREIL